MIRGVDVASFQQSPASWRSAAGDIAWAGVKICELGVNGSRYVDPDAAADWAWLRERGLGRIGYAYAHPATLPSATVALLAAELHALGLEDGDAVALDLEVTDDLSAAEVSAYGRATMAALKATFEREPLLYTFLSFADAGNCAGLGSYPLWIADPSRPAGQPRVPAPWKTWAVHQHNWTPIDADVANWPTLAAMRAAIGKPAPAKPPEGRTVAFTADGTRSLQAIAAARKTSPAYILHLTAQAGPAWPAPVHDWLDALFAGKAQAGGPVPKGCTFQVPAP